MGYHSGRVDARGAEDVKKYLLMIAAGGIWLLAMLAKGSRATKQAESLSVAHQSTIAKAGNESLRTAQKAAQRAVQKVNRAQKVRDHAETKLRDLSRPNQESHQERLKRLSGRG